MREGIHPVYEEATVHCSCGNTFKTRSTKKELHVELCDLCHPFYTGQQRLVDTAGRVERFKKRFESTGGKTVVRKPIKTASKSLEQVGGGKAIRRSILSTAPKQEEKAKTAAKKPAPAKKEA